MLNKVELIGRLARMPEVRHTQTGDKVVTLSVATSETWTDRRTGELRERTEWHRVVIFAAALADLASGLPSGALIQVEGQLQTRKWRDQTGRDIYTTEVVLQPFKGSLLPLSLPTAATTTEEFDAPDADPTPY